MKETAFKALVGPLLEYSPVWDTYTVSCSNSVEKYQKQAERWAMQDCKLTSSMTAMLEEAIAAVKKKEGQTHNAVQILEWSAKY